ncbi:hypothetical protein DAPPUDRAFT_323629 [Daphnia pulex]|uniref:Uncharacterized protein n=1 Tax=Daphnia pulex TaxID=6669 RepID=E9GZB9_DAPPU|nr:hypothetical protein DAPPUDRAFT_323629 [Daphnia pulex]|eukprot:EFX75187.1 hypothetical protein DAPPUDRAFT_323629 [Daphnia pulex]
MDYNSSSIQDKWKALSKEEQLPYYDVTEMTHELVENEKKAIDKEIISLRPGKRQYSGYKISRRILQKDKHAFDKRAFNPVLWYQCYIHHQEAGKLKAR